VSARQTAREGAGGGAPVAVELAIDDGGLAERIRAMVLEHPDVRLTDSEEGPAPEVRITDGAAGGAADVAVIVITDRAGAMDALQTGAAAVLSVHIDGEGLRAAILAAAAGLTTLSAGYRDLLLDDAEAAGGLEQEGGLEPTAIDLTPRESQVLQLLAQGASNKVIARRLEITPHTAKFHVASIVAKLGAKGRTDAVARAMRLGLVMI
jgi:DNA-binding NarL/FixJ family response regulator